MNSHIIPLNASAKDVNEVIQELKKTSTTQYPFEVGTISDGYHTFDELYEHRIANFISLCSFVAECSNETVWRSKAHSDGGSWDGWFILGINKKHGEQITYHLPIEKWDACNFVHETLDRAPEFDGHTSKDVLERIALL